MLKFGILNVDHLNPSKGGFTLAELLTALAILGIVATFTIPKIVASQADAKRLAIFKEDIATVENIVLDLFQSGQIRIGSHSCASSTPLNNVVFLPMLNSTLNYVQLVNSGPLTFTLHNGSTVLYDAGTFPTFTIWNGSSNGANSLGDDQIQFSYIDCDSATAIGAGPLLQPGQFGPNPPSANRVLWETIFR
jgi:prepilin-type N-terminal cleavage/methylation domain-containing protein